MQSRSDLIAYAEQHNIPIPVTKEKPYSTDRNLLHISYEAACSKTPGVSRTTICSLLSVSQTSPEYSRYVGIDYGLAILWQ
jgi:argininosuccinate synthase